MKKHISLSITERCNLNCIYCFERSKCQKTMTFETAIKTIYYELENSPEYDEISCDFMGGEPFLEFELIKKVCEYFWSQDIPKKISFYTTTNGTLVHGEIMEWLRANRNRFSCMLSLDGTSESHNHNRSNSFERIDIPFFIEMWPNMKVKAITSKDTLINLSENVIFLHEVGFKKVEMKLAYGFDWNDKSVNEVLIGELNKLKFYYLSNTNIVPCTLLNFDFMQINYIDKPIKKWCNAGESTVSYDMEGNRYPCRYFQDLVKNKHISLEDMWTHNYSKIQESLSGRCLLCKIRDLCRTCYAYNYECNHDFGKKECVSCTATRTTITIAAEIVVNKYESLPNSIDSTQYEKAKIVCDAAKHNKWFIEL